MKAHCTALLMLQGRVVALEVGENPGQGIETANKPEEAFRMLPDKAKAALVGAALVPSRSTPAS